MKHHILSVGLLAALAVSCAINEIDSSKSDRLSSEVFYAQFENPNEDPSTRVYATEDLYIRWNADDRITIFNKYTYNQEYRFNGETGDNSGSFKRVDNGDFVTGNSLDNIYAIYPYLESTRISDTGVMTVTLPAEQKYAENTFGLGANTMISATSDNQLMFKNVGGYLMLKLYGEDVTVSSISLRGNNGEKLSGKATVTMPVDGIPSIEMANDAGEEIMLVCDEPVKIGKTAETATPFWLVVPPTTIESGITLTVKTADGKVFEKSTTGSLAIARNTRSKMAALEVTPVDPWGRYLTFTSEGTTTVSLSNYNENAPVLYYSTDKTNWTQWDYSELTFTSEQPLYLCGNNQEGVSSSDAKYSQFVAFGDRFCVSGDIMSLIDSKYETTVIPSSYCFSGLFIDCTGLTTAPGLPATTLAERCYSHMFVGCTSLTSAPVLPATTLAESCYYGTFQDCTSLTTAPDLPATTLAKSCYYGMFSGCTSLVTAPELPATTLTERCYSSMFYGCTSLTAAPNLPATSLTSVCYFYMFSGCTSLTTAPELPATTLADSCYSGLFSGCSGLTAAPGLPATTLADYCYSNMFAYCPNLTAAPELPATTLASGCYSGMFRGCTSLTTAPVLPSITLAARCYARMFDGCTSLTTAPELPATTLAERCYYGMFRDCANINHIQCLAKNISANECLNDWLAGVASTGTFIKAPGVTWPTGASGIPEGWTVIDDGDSSLPVTIKTADEFVAWAAEGTKSATLAADITLPAGFTPATVTADFDGGNKTITVTNQAGPVFASTTGAVKNVVFAGSFAAADATAKLHLAPIGKSTGAIENVINKATVTYTGVGPAVNAGVTVAGVACEAYGPVKNCKNQAKVSADGAGKDTWGLVVGGIIGFAGAAIEDCENSGEVSLVVGSPLGRTYGMTAVTMKYNPCPAVSGIVVYAVSDDTHAVSVRHCNNSGKITMTYDNLTESSYGATRTGVTGIVSAGGCPIVDCTNTGDIYCNAYGATRGVAITTPNIMLHPAGIHGSDYYAKNLSASASTIDQDETTITGCTNSGNIYVDSDCTKSNSAVGGISGWPAAENAKTVVSKILNCTNTGDITIKGVLKVRVGGVAGGTSFIEGCKSTGNILVENADAGSIAGLLNGFHTQAQTLKDCEVSGKIESKVKILGIGGLCGGIGNAENTFGENCKVNATLVGGGTAQVGLIVGVLMGTTKKVTVGTPESPVRVSGSVDGVTATADNFQTLLHNATNYRDDIHTFHAVFGN